MFKMLQKIIVLSLLISVCFGASLVDVLNSTQTFAFFKLLDHAGLVELLQTGNHTVFVPSNSALTGLPADVLISLKNDKTTLANMIRYHIIPNTVPADALENDLQLTSLTGMPVRINKYTQKKGTLTLVQGETLQTTLPEATNGRAYIISNVIKPPQGTIKEVIQNTPEYSKFYGFLNKTKLLTLLEQQDANFTVFAWPNSAWEKLVKNDMTTGLQFSGELLIEVAKYHILPKTIFSKSFTNGGVYGTLKVTDNVEVQLLPTGNKVNYANITKSDISATNGVIHETNKILLPKSLLKIAKQFTNLANDKTAVAKIMEGNGL